MAVDRTRRRVLWTLAGVPLGGLLASLADKVFARGQGAGRSPAAGAGAAPATGASAPGAARSVVARCRREGLVVPGGRLDAAKLDEVLGRAVAKASGAETPLAAMRRLFKPQDVVGIKVNCIAGKGLSSSPQLVARLADWLQEAGVPAGNIVIWDRADRELAAAGFTIARGAGSVRCMGTNDDYDWAPQEWGAGGSCFARLLVKDLTALINVCVLKDHDLAGISGGLKTWYGAIHNPNKMHGDGCAPYIPHLAAYPLIRGKLRLTVVDATTAQCHGGPARSPRWAWPYQGVLASTDPVAIDSISWKMIEERRREVGLPALAAEKREPRWIATAAGLGLGEADPARIEVVDL